MTVNGHICFSVAFKEELKILKEETEKDTELKEMLKNSDRDNMIQTDTLLTKALNSSKAKKAERVVKLGLLSFFNR